MNHLLHPDADVSIVVTDSGLGGLDVAARLVQRVRAQRLCRRLRVTFVNCKPAATLGYHDLADDGQRQEVFSRALDAMTHRFRPDAILIACNTLSAIYDQTAFASSAAVPVQGIIDAGCDMAADYLRRQPSGRVVLFSTSMTCDADVHCRTLVKVGFDSRQMIAQRCPGLPGAIDRDPHSPAVRAKVEQAVDEALRQIDDHAQPIAAALCCTHFGYVAELFTHAFGRRGVEIEVLNPNLRMVEHCIAGCASGAEPPAVEVQVVTQSPQSAAVKAALAPLIERIDPETAEALHHDAVEQLFEVT